MRMKKVRKKELLKEKGGFTLVEVITAFALTAVLVASASAVFGVFMKTYVRVRSTAQAQSVAGTLMETIVGALESAAEVRLPKEPGAAKWPAAFPACALYISADGSVLYTDYDQRTVHMYVNGEGQLELDCVRSGGEAATAAERGDTGNEKDTWHYPDSFYSGCTIERLEVSKADDGRNLLEVTLELKHAVGEVTYSTTRMLECYNLKAADIAAADKS